VNPPKPASGKANAKVDADSPTSARLLDAAARLFWTKGYASTTTREIAALLGVQKASLYHHVARKEDLLYEICVASLEHIRKAVHAAVEAVPDPLERIRTLIRAHVAAMLVDQDKHSTMLTELRALSPDRRAEIVALRDAYEKLVRSVLDRAQRAGVIRDDIPVKYLSVSLLNLMNWAIFWFQRDGDLSPVQLGDLFVTLYLGGVTVSPPPTTSAGHQNL
jgi:AcrR family transcriptional regulator